MSLLPKPLGQRPQLLALILIVPNYRYRFDLETEGSMEEAINWHSSIVSIKILLNRQTSHG